MKPRGWCAGFSLRSTRGRPTHRWPGDIVFLPQYECPQSPPLYAEASGEASEAIQGQVRRGAEPGTARGGDGRRGADAGHRRRGVGEDAHPHLSGVAADRDRKSTRLNSSHSQISYAVFCLKKKKKIATPSY